MRSTLNGNWELRFYWDKPYSSTGPWYETKTKHGWAKFYTIKKKSLESLLAASPLSLKFDGEEKGIAATAMRENAPMFRGIPEHTPLRVGPKHWPERKQGEGCLRLLPRGSHTWTICAWKELLTNTCLQKSKLDSKTCFPYSSGDGGRASVPTAVTRHRVSAVPSGVGSHWTSVTLWGCYHYHLHSKVLSVPQSLSHLTQE